MSEPFSPELDLFPSTHQLINSYDGSYPIPKQIIPIGTYYTNQEPGCHDGVFIESNRVFFIYSTELINVGSHFYIQIGIETGFQMNNNNDFYIEYFEICGIPEYVERATINGIDSQSLYTFRNNICLSIMYS